MTIVGLRTGLSDPNPAHRLDARPFRARHPQAKVITAPNAVDRVREAVPVDGSKADMGEEVELLGVAGVDRLELSMLVRHPGGCSLVTNDIIDQQPAAVLLQLAKQLSPS